MTETAPTETSPKIEPEQTHVLLEQALPSPLTACHWEPKSRFILVGSEEYGIRRFNLETKESVPMIGPHDSWVRAIGTSPDGEVTYTGGYDGRLVWWPTAAEKPEPIRVIPDAHQGWIRALAVSPDGSRIATCGNDKMVRLWDSQSGEMLKCFQGHQWHVYNVAFSPAGDALIACDLHGFVKVWDPSPAAAPVAAEAAPAAAADPPAAPPADPLAVPGPPAETTPAAPAAATEPPPPAVPGLLRELPQLEALFKYDTGFRADIGGARCIAFSADGSRLAIGGVTNVTNAFAGVGDAAIVLVNMPESRIAVQMTPKEKVQGTAWGIARHPSGCWIGLAAGGGGGWLYFWKDDQAEEFFKLKLKSDGRGMCLSPDGTRVAVAHSDKNLRIYGLFAAPPAS